MTSSDSTEAMQEIDSDADGLVSRDEVEAWWDDRSPPHKAVFTAAEERERRESQRAIERKFKAREAEMGRRISDAERQVKVEVAKRVQQEQLLRAEMQTSRSLRVDAGQLAEAQSALATARAELDARAQELSELGRLQAVEVTHAETVRAMQAAETRSATAEQALHAAESRAAMAEQALQVERRQAQLRPSRPNPELEERLRDAESRAAAAEAAAAAAASESEAQQRAAARAQSSRIAELEDRAQQAEQQAERQATAHRAELRRLKAASQHAPGADEIESMEAQLREANTRAAAAKAAERKAQQAAQAQAEAIAEITAERDTAQRRQKASQKEQSERQRELVSERARADAAEAERNDARAKLARSEKKAEVQQGPGADEIEALETRLREANARAQAAKTAERKAQQAVQSQAESQAEANAEIQAERATAQRRQKASQKEQAERQRELESERARADAAEAERDDARAKLARSEKKHGQAMAQQQSALQEELEQLQQAEEQHRRQAAQRESALRTSSQQLADANGRASAAEQSLDDEKAARKRELAAKVREVERKAESEREQAASQAEAALREQQDLVRAAEQKAENARLEADRVRKQAGQDESQKVQALEEQLSETQEDSKKALADANAQKKAAVARSEENLAAAKRERDEMEQRCTAAEDEQQQAAEELQRTKKQLSAAEKQLSAAKEQQRRDSEEAAAEQDHLTQLKKSAEQLAEQKSADLKRLRKQAGQEQSEQVQELEALLKEEEDRAQAAESERNSQVASWQRKHTTLAERLQTTERELEEAKEGQQAGLDQQSDALRREKKALERDKKMLEERLQTMEQELEDAREELEAGEDQQSDASVLRREKKALEREKQTLEKQRTQLEEDLEDKETEIEDYRRRNADLRADLEAFGREDRALQEKEAISGVLDLAADSGPDLVSGADGEAGTESPPSHAELSAKLNSVAARFADPDPALQHLITTSRSIDHDESSTVMRAAAEDDDDSMSDADFEDLPAPPPQQSPPQSHEKVPPQPAPEPAPAPALDYLEDYRRELATESDLAPAPTQPYLQDPLPPQPQGSLQPEAPAERLSISMPRGSEGFGMDISDSGHVVGCKRGGVADQYGVPVPGQAVPGRGTVETCRVAEVNWTPVQTKEDIIAELNAAGDPVSFVFMYDVVAGAPPLQHEQPEYDPYADPHDPYDQAQSGVKYEDSVLHTESAQETRIDLPKPLSGEPIGMKIISDGEVLSCTDGSVAKLRGVPVPSKIVEVNGQGVSTKEAIFELMGSAEPGSTVSFVFLAEPHVIEAAKADAVPGPPADDPPEDLPTASSASQSIEELREQLKTVQGRLSETDPADAAYGELLAEVEMLTGMLDAKKLMEGPAPVDMSRYEGFMKKMSPKKGASWQERFFTFADGKLTYYKGKDARAMFTDLDVDGSGALDEKEFAKLCRDLGRKLNKKAMAEAMAEMDRDGNGTVEWREFDIWWQANGGNALKKNQPAGEIILAECSDVSTTILTGGSMQINIETVKRQVQLLPPKGASPDGATQPDGRPMATADRWLELITDAVPRKGSEAAAEAELVIAAKRAQASKGGMNRRKEAPVPPGGEGEEGDEAPEGMTKMQKLRWKREQKKKTEALASGAAEDADGAEGAGPDRDSLSGAPGEELTPSKKMAKQEEKRRKAEEWAAANPEKAAKKMLKKGAAGTILDERIQTALKKLGLEVYAKGFAARELDLGGLEALDGAWHFVLSQRAQRTVSDRPLTALSQRPALMSSWTKSA